MVKIRDRRAIGQNSALLGTDWEPTAANWIGRFTLLIPSDPLGPVAMAQHEQAVDGAQNAGTDAASQGPPSELPAAVPDFVGDIQSSIDDFLGGGVENLGEAVSGVASNGDAGEAAAAAADVAMIIPL
jgi:hypothetical protein